jgi:hypothetical protein
VAQRKRRARRPLEGDLAEPTRAHAAAFAFLWLLASAFMGFFVWILGRSFEVRSAKQETVGVNVAILAAFGVAAVYAVTTFFRRAQAAVEAPDFFVRSEPEGLSIRCPGGTLWRFLGVRFDVQERVLPWDRIVELYPVVRRWRRIPVGSDLLVDLADGERVAIPMLVFKQTARELAERVGRARAWPPGS